MSRDIWESADDRNPGVTGTAFIVAEYRARENAEANPLYIDRIVPLFLDVRTRQAADSMSPTTFFAC
jgi:hypothetical protein